MPKLSCKIGYVEELLEPNGITVYDAMEVRVKADLLKDWNNNVVGDQGSTIDDVVINNQVSFIAGKYAYTHSQNIRYAVVDGQRWRVTAIEVRKPRLILTLGGVYNGPTPQTESSASS